MTTAVTVTSVPLINSQTHRYVYVTVYASATPTEPTEVIIYDPTTTPYTNSGAYVRTRIRKIVAWSSCGGASGVQANMAVNWDASTPVVAFSIPTNSSIHIDCCMQPLMNQGGTGVTGKLGLTALGMIAGDSITMLIDIING